MHILLVVWAVLVKSSVEMKLFSVHGGVSVCVVYALLLFTRSYLYGRLQCLRFCWLKCMLMWFCHELFVQCSECNSG